MLSLLGLSASCFLPVRPLEVGFSPTPRLRRPPREWRGCGLWEPVIHRNNSEIRLFSPMLSYSAGPYRVLCPTTIARPALLYPHRAKLRPNRWPTPPEGRDPPGTRNGDLSGDLVRRQLVGRYCWGRDLFARTLPSDLEPAYEFLLAGSLIEIFGRLDARTYLEAGRSAAFARE